MNRRSLNTLCGLLVVTLALGCSRASNSPTSPPTTGELAQASSDGVAPASRHLWGLWNVQIDTSTGTIDTIPLRGAAFTANVNNLLESKPGNLLIEDLDVTDYMTEGKLACTVVLRHPLPGIDEYHGFDVWGVFIHNGASQLSYEGLTYPAGPSDGGDEAVLLNADGYTRWFNQPEFDGDGIPIMEFWPGKLSDLPKPTSVLNGYRVFADGLDEEDDYYTWITSPGNADDRGIYRAGMVNSRRYELQFPLVGGAPVLTFQYAVVASWEPGDPTLTGDPMFYDPLDFPISANCAEPFFVHATTDDSSLYNDGAGQAGGAFKADIEVFDWQGGSVGGLGVPNEVNRMIIEGSFIPTVSQEFSHDQLLSLAFPGTGNSSVFQIEITGCDPQASGPAEFWAIIEGAGLNTDTYGQGFPTAYPDSRRAAFLRGIVEVATEPAGFTVTAIDPNAVPFWSIVEDAMVFGSAFEDGATVELRKTGEDPVQATGVLWIGPGSLQCDFDLRTVDSGVWDVVVINPDLAEGILPAGFTIEPWSEEEELSASGCRLPALAETSSASMVLATANSDNTLKYQAWDGGGGGWSGPYLLAGASGNNIMLGIGEDPANEYVYLSNGPTPVYRYTGGTGLWESAWDPISWCRCSIVTADTDGRIHIFDNTNSAFGWVIQLRAPYWGYTGSWNISYFMDSYNDKTLSEGNIIAQNSSGTIFCAYEKDRALDPYMPGTGPRSVRVGISLLGQLVQYNFHVIEETWDEHLDSPAITCDPDDVVHVAYRRFVDSSSEWRIDYERSTDGGNNWGSSATAWSGTTEPEDGYVFLLSDSEGNLHIIYRIAETIEYKQSSDGSTWPGAETVNESSPPSGKEDVTPYMTVTDDDIMHVVWVRRDLSANYGAVIHRMRDLL